MGILVMLLTGFLLVQYFKSVNSVPKTQSTSSAATEQAAEPTSVPVKNEASVGKPVTPAVPAVPAISGSDYVVQKGDTLWAISAKAYGSGYDWTKIYAANKQALGNNPSLISTGTKISLPKVEAQKTVEYTVVKGDSMWNIATKLCGSGSQYTQIALDNHLTNPSLIHAGTVFKVNCR